MTTTAMLAPYKEEYNDNNSPHTGNQDLTGTLWVVLGVEKDHLGPFKSILRLLMKALACTGGRGVTVWGPKLTTDITLWQQ